MPQLFSLIPQTIVCPRVGTQCGPVEELNRLDESMLPTRSPKRFANCSRALIPMNLCILTLACLVTSSTSSTSSTFAADAALDSRPADSEEKGTGLLR